MRVCTSHKDINALYVRGRGGSNPFFPMLLITDVGSGDGGDGDSGHEDDDDELSKTIT